MKPTLSPILLFTLSTITTSACDIGEPGQCLGLGGPFGRCDHHLAFLCLDDLECLQTATGEICVPPVSHPLFDREAVEDCGSLVGDDVRCSSIDDRCVVSCVSEPCSGGTVCDPSTRVCVYPD